MANITIQDAVDRIAVKTKELAEDLDTQGKANNTAIATINQELTTIKNKATELENSKVQKQLAGNIDFTDIENLRQLLLDDDFTAITLATGEKVTGRITDKGQNGDPIVIGGYANINDVNKFGQVTINPDLSLSIKEPYTTPKWEAWVYDPQLPEEKLLNWEFRIKYNNYYSTSIVKKPYKDNNNPQLITFNSITDDTFNENSTEITTFKFLGNDVSFLSNNYNNDKTQYSITITKANVGDFGITWEVKKWT